MGNPKRSYGKNNAKRRLANTEMVGDPDQDLDKWEPKIIWITSPPDAAAELESMKLVIFQAARIVYQDHKAKGKPPLRVWYPRGTVHNSTTKVDPTATQAKPRSEDDPHLTLFADTELDAFDRKTEQFEYASHLYVKHRVLPEATIAERLMHPTEFVHKRYGTDHPILLFDNNDNKETFLPDEGYYATFDNDQQEDEGEGEEDEDEDNEDGDGDEEVEEEVEGKGKGKAKVKGKAKK